MTKSSFPPHLVDHEPLYVRSRRDLAPQVTHRMYPPPPAPARPARSEPPAPPTSTPTSTSFPHSRPTSVEAPRSMHAERPCPMHEETPRSSNGEASRPTIREAPRPATAEPLRSMNVAPSRPIDANRSGLSTPAMPREQPLASQRPSHAGTSRPSARYEPIHPMISTPKIVASSPPHEEQPRQDSPSQDEPMDAVPPQREPSVPPTVQRQEGTTARRVLQPPAPVRVAPTPATTAQTPHAANLAPIHPVRLHSIVAPPPMPYEPTPRPTLTMPSSPLNLFDAPSIVQFEEGPAVGATNAEEVDALLAQALPLPAHPFSEDELDRGVSVSTQGSRQTTPVLSPPRQSTPVFIHTLRRRQRRALPRFEQAARMASIPVPLRNEPEHLTLEERIRNGLPIPRRRREIASVAALISLAQAEEQTVVYRHSAGQKVEREVQETSHRSLMARSSNDLHARAKVQYAYSQEFGVWYPAPFEAGSAVACVRHHPMNVLQLQAFQKHVRAIQLSTHRSRTAQAFYQAMHSRQVGDLRMIPMSVTPSLVSLPLTRLHNVRAVRLTNAPRTT